MSEARWKLWDRVSYDGNLGEVKELLPDGYVRVRYDNGSEVLEMGSDLKVDDGPLHPLTIFKQAIESAVRHASDDGAPTTGHAASVAKAFRSLDANGRSRARNWMAEAMVATMSADAPVKLDRARALVELNKVINEGLR